MSNLNIQEIRAAVALIDGKGTCTCKSPCSKNVRLWLTTLCDRVEEANTIIESFHGQNVEMQAKIKTLEADVLRLKEEVHEVYCPCCQVRTFRHDCIGMLDSEQLCDECDTALQSPQETPHE